MSRKRYNSKFLRNIGPALVGWEEGIKNGELTAKDFRPGPEDYFHRTCPSCGKKFETTLERKLFCSKKCNQAGWHSRKNNPGQEWVKKLCEFCGKEFEIAGRYSYKIYCSPGCRNKATKSFYQKGRGNR